MAEVREPGSNSKVGTAPKVFQLETERLVINALLILLYTSVASSNLEIGLGVE